MCKSRCEDGGSGSGVSRAGERNTRKNNVHHACMGAAQRRKSGVSIPAWRVTSKCRLRVCYRPSK